MGFKLERIHNCFSKTFEANYRSSSSYVFCIAPLFLMFKDLPNLHIQLHKNLLIWLRNEINIGMCLVIGMCLIINIITLCAHLMY